MLRSTLLATGLLVGSITLGAFSANAAPGVPQAGLVAGNTVEVVRMDNRRGSMMRQKRRMNVRRNGNPNAKNPALEGYQQNMGNVSGGPRR